MDYHGGLDEYLMKTSDELIPCDIAQMYKRKIKEAYQGRGESAEALETMSKDLRDTLLEKYGADYVE
jgi:hypothetical protein